MNPTRLSLPLIILLTALGLMACGGTTAERVSRPRLRSLQTSRRTLRLKQFLL